LSLKPSITTDATTGRDVVVLFDTSASQVGAYRTDALEALHTMLRGLNSQDRVKLVAVDVNAVPMNDSFVAADSDAMKTALAKLDRRVPLGSTDLAVAMKSAAASFTNGGGVDDNRFTRVIPVFEP